MTNSGRHERADGLLEEALAMPADRRPAFLERECGADEELRSLVERLLAHAETPTELDGLGVGAAIDLHANACAMPDPLGKVINDRYEIQREIGRGGMGRVYAAHDLKLGRRVAIKILVAPDLGLRARERFQREARAAAALNHPNIITVHDVGEMDDWPFLVMELVDGPSLEAQPPETIEQAIAVAEGLCLALQHAHDRGLVHRDLKPSNVLLLSGESGPSAVKLADLGIAFITNDVSRVTRAGAIVGTPAFMAPECALGQRPDGRADLYSLGVMLYLWTTGRLPFEGDDTLTIVSQHIHAPVVPPSTFRCDLPAAMDALIVSLLAKTATARPESANQVREALRSDAAVTVDVRPVRLDCLHRGRLVGRRTELDRLQELRRASGDERIPMALISGEPGVGKTRLARELIAGAQFEGVAIVSGGCYENEATTPYLPFIEAIRAWVSEHDDERLAAMLGDSAAEIVRMAPEIESRMGPFPTLPSLSPAEERLRLFDHVARFLRRLADPKRLLVFIDDLQWADGSTISLLQYLLRHLASDDVFFLATYREAELGRTHPLSKALAEWNRMRLVERIRLDRFNFEETNHLLTALLAQETLPDRLVSALYTETEGSPFFIEEVVKALIAEGDLVRDQEAWRRRSSGEFVLPQSVKMAIGSRLETISETSQQVLRIAAVLGKTFEFDELATVSPIGESELLDALDEADCAQLVVAGRGESFSFTHDKIREVLYEELNPIRRRRLHSRIAEGLERLHTRGEEIPVEQLAYHYVESGDHDKGLIWARRAAEAASRLFAWDEVLAALHRARECASILDDADEVARIDLTSGEAALAQGDLIHATDHFERGLAIVRDEDLRGTLRARAGEAYVTSGDPRGREHVNRALAELDDRRRPWEAGLATVVEARYRHLAGDYRGAVDGYCKGIPLVESSGDSQLLVRSLSFLAGTYQHMARFGESDDVSRRCIEIGRAEGVPDGVMLGDEFLSENAYYRGYWDACIRHGEEEEALALEYQAGERYLWSHFRGHALYAVGRIEEADALFVRGIAESEQSGERRLGLFLKMGRALSLSAQGRDGEALELADALIREVDDADLLVHRIMGRGIRSAIARGSGDREKQLEIGRVGAELWFAQDSVGVGLIYGADLAEALVCGGASESECLTVLDRHLALAEAAEAPHRSGQNRRVRARLAERQSRFDEARRLLDEALALVGIHGGRVEQTLVLVARGGLARRQGDEEGASADLERAGELIRRHGLPATLLAER